MNEARIEDLESKVAFQDDLIESLNEVVAKQDREILALKQRLSELAAKIEDIASSAPGSAGQEHEPPPHY